MEVQKRNIRNGIQKIIGQLCRLASKIVEKQVWTKIDKKINKALCRKLTEKLFITDYIPTKDTRTYKISYDDQKWHLVDTSGRKRDRVFWLHQFNYCHGIVFIIDVFDSEKFPEVKAVFFLVRQKIGDRHYD